MFYFVKYTPISMAGYEYPPWGELLGFMISLSSMIWVPGYFVYYMLTTPGTWREVLRKGVTPVIVPRAEALTARKGGLEEVEKQLLQTPEKVRVEEEEGGASQQSQSLLEEEQEESSSTSGVILSNNC